MDTLSVTQKGTTITLDTETLLLTVEVGDAVWKTTCAPYVSYKCKEGKHKTISLTEAGKVVTSPWKTGVGEGFITSFEGIPGTGMSLETIYWVDNCRGELFAELIPHNDPKDEWAGIVFPTAFEFSDKSTDCYTVVTRRQGGLLLNNRSYQSADFHGQYYTNAAYMPWFGQVCKRDAYICIGITPWDGGYLLQEKDDGTKEISQYWIPSLGRISYRRTARYTFTNGDYNTLAKLYRQYARETGLLVTLEEKAVRNPNVARLEGCAIVNAGIYQNISPDSHFYDKENPENNSKLHATFDQRAAQMRILKEKWGLDKVYFHMDGWGIDGYDSHHPDYLPPNDKAGGWEGMKRLSDTMNELGYLFATHDQYRDYHYNAESFDEEMAVHDTKGDITVHSYWYGGKQSFLCSSQAPAYVRRNYQTLEEHGINLQGTYQDVFTIVALDECDHPWHRVSRKECAEYRKACFDYVMAHGIAISSEEAIDWAMQTLCFCHYAPSIPSIAPDFEKGIPVPLFNLVYHDCLLYPVYLDRGSTSKSNPREGINGLLEALMMGGAGSLPIEPSQEEVERYQLVAALQEKVQYAEMFNHEYITPYIQKTSFEGGINVTINTQNDSYQIDGM